MTLSQYSFQGPSRPILHCVLLSCLIPPAINTNHSRSPNQQDSFTISDWPQYIHHVQLQYMSLLRKQHSENKRV